MPVFAGPAQITFIIILIRMPEAEKSHFNFLKSKAVYFACEVVVFVTCDVTPELPCSFPRTRLELRARLAFVSVRLKYAKNTPVLQAELHRARMYQFRTWPQVGVHDASCTVHDEKFMVPTNRVVHLFYAAGAIIGASTHRRPLQATFLKFCSSILEPVRQWKSSMK